MELREVDERVKLQFDYGWKWFESAARQRMTMFNYYLIVTGILSNALVISYKEEYSTITVAIGVIGILTSLGFLSFDVRNRGMAAIGEDILEKLESEVIFPADFINDRGQKLGPLCVERRKKMREGQKRPLRSNVLKHKYWIWAIQAAFAVFFSIGIVMAVRKAAEDKTALDVAGRLETIEKLTSEQTTVMRQIRAELRGAVESVREDIRMVESKMREMESTVERMGISIGGAERSSEGRSGGERDNQKEEHRVNQ